MGYEIRLHIAQEWTHNTDEYDREFGRTVHELATIDLSVPGYDSAIAKLTEESQKLQAEISEATGIRYLLATIARGEDGDSIYVGEDEYGKPLAAIPLRTVYAALLRDFADSMTPGKPGYINNGYRRFAIAIALIEAVLMRFRDDEGRGELVAIPYGH